MFRDCRALKTIPLIDTSKSTNFGFTFQQAFALETIPLLNTSNVTFFGQMFGACYALRYVPNINTNKGTNFNSMFINCLSLKIIPSSINLSLSTDSLNFANNCNALQRCEATGATRSLSFTTCDLNANELNNIYTNLGTAAGAQTITVTGNRGTATDNPTIATAKGWTVTG
jgi:hypothetical protein